MERKILPFYLTYPEMVYSVDKMVRSKQQPEGSEKEDYVKDLEYFQQMYPAGAKQLHKEIVKALAILDHDGSVIYDEYPDRFGLYKIAKDIITAICSKVWDGECVSEEEAGELQKLLANGQLEEYILLVLFQEIIKRRQLKRQ